MEWIVPDGAAPGDPSGVPRSARSALRGMARRHPLALGAAGAVILGLAGVALMAGPFPASDPGKAPGHAATDAAAPPGERPDHASTAQGVRVAGCVTCGTVESVRAVEAQERTVYRVTVRMDDGSYRAISQPIAPGIGAGEKVRIVDSALLAGR